MKTEKIQDIIKILSPYFSTSSSEPVKDMDSMREWAKRKKLKYADYGEAIWIPTVGRFHTEWEGSPYTAGQIAKAYLHYQEWSWPLHRPGKIYEEIGPAIYFKGEATGDWVYLDLKSAYWQIGSRIPWWTEGPGKSTRRDGKEGTWKNPELINEFRLPRIVLFGLLTWPGPATLWVFPDGTTKMGECPPKKSPYGNRIWGQSVLTLVHAFAQDLMKTFPSVPLFMTDGAMVDSRFAENVIGWAIDSWNLDLRPKERGEGKVSGPGNYEFRATYRKNQRSEPVSSFKNLVTEEIRTWWLKIAGD